MVASVCTAGEFHALAGALNDRGWHTAQDADGNLLLYPKPDTTRVAATSSQKAGGRLDVLAERLAAAGWQVNRDADGGIRFHAASSADAQSKTIRKTPSATPLTDLGARLAATGWQVRRIADGSLIFWRTGPPPAGLGA